MLKDRSASGDPVGERRSGAVRWGRRLLLLAWKLLLGLSAASLLLSIALLFELLSEVVFKRD
jgi:hypothetical protein